MIFRDLSGNHVLSALQDRLVRRKNKFAVLLVASARSPRLESLLDPFIPRAFFPCPGLADYKNSLT
jgi:hypothetical protein